MDKIDKQIESARPGLVRDKRANGLACWRPLLIVQVNQPRLFLEYHHEQIVVIILSDAD